MIRLRPLFNSHLKAFFSILALLSPLALCAGPNKSEASVLPVAEREAILALPWKLFDQTQDSGWRIYVNPTRKDYSESIELIEAYLDRHKDLPERQRVLCHFHAASNYIFWARASGGDPKAAIPDLDQAIFTGKGPAHSLDWNDMVIATKAFLLGDRQTLIAVKARVAAMPPKAADWPGYADDLLNNLGKPFGSWWPTEDLKK